ncbi:MAG: BspA family leucine-rich repeat surface protein, partial [Erysipelotrichaceae bacterium]|nr:BspA family leucine-rich repeat surface protein [Erysipelotrichaceae bacterium]
SCKELTTIDVSNFNTSNVTNMSSMFNGCRSVKVLDVSGFNTENVTSMHSLFNYCASLVSLDVSNFNTSNVTTMKSMFYDCNNLKSLNVSNFDTSKVTDMYGMFENCKSLASIDVANFDTSKVEDMSYMFDDCSSLPSLDVTNFDTSNVTSMARMFNNCSSLPSLDVTNFNTSNVTNMEGMFKECTSLSTLDVTNFNTSNVTKMGYMFSNCSSLPTLDVSNFDTSNVKDMKWMFYYCTSLPELDLSNFDTSNVESMYAMFYNCNSLTSLNVSSFNTDKVTDMSYMFGYCRSLPTLNLSNFNTENVTTMEQMFKTCTKLTTIYADEWNTNNVQVDSEMFLDSTNLVGVSADGIQTPYDPNRIGKAMATSNGGYFTAPKLEDWTATVNYVNQAGQVIGTQNFKITNFQPVIASDEIKRFIPNGYEAVNEVRAITATENNQVFEVVVQEVEWTVNLEYQTADGTTVKTESIQVTQLNPTVSAQTISEKVPTGYELVDPATDWTPTVNGEKKVIQVREVEWTLMVEFVTEDSRGVVETVTFNVSGLNPVIEAQRIIDAIPAGYYAPNEIQDLRATKDGEVFQVTVEKIESREGIVHFVDQNGITVKTEVYKVTNKDAIIRVDELEKALPTGATLVKPLTELTVTKDKEEFIIEVI